MSAAELKRDLEITNKNLDFYKQKVKEVVSAYKSLEAEKKALEKVVSSVGSSVGGEKNESATQLDTLKNALGELTREKMKREQAYLSDKKALMEEVEKQKSRADKIADQLRDAQGQLEHAAKIVTRVKEQKQRIKQIEALRDSELQDHGLVLAEQQKRYAEEKTRADRMAKRVAELERRLQEKDSYSDKKDSDIKTLTEKFTAEIQEWKAQAVVTPTLQILQDQILNLKKEHETAMKESRTNLNYECTGVEENRRRDLEDRIVRLTEQSASAERKYEECDQRLKDKEKEIEQLKEAVGRPHTPLKESKANTTDAIVAFESAFELVRKEQPDFDIFGAVGARAEICKWKEKIEKLSDDFERYKIKAEVALKKKSSTEDSRDSLGNDDGLRQLIGQLHDKMRSLEVAHSTDRAQYETTLQTMRQRISELELSEQHFRNEAKKEMTTKIAEMEIEMRRQRERTTDLLAEKESELEATRNILVTLRSEQFNCAPVDPSHKRQLSKKKSHELSKYGERRKSSGTRRSTDSISSAFEYHPESTSHIPLANESRNIYYEEEMSKKDAEIRELRNSLHQMDYRTRELEQNHLTKDLQQHEQADKLKEEIRILESKLKLLSSGGDVEYLRNIFVQLLACKSEAAKKNILKAMGMCLKLSPNEMKVIDRKAL